MHKICLVFLILLLANVILAVPRYLVYQGKLTDLSGIGINADIDIEFRIYDASTGGTDLWRETHADVTVLNGLFEVMLGSDSLLYLDFSGPEYWLEIHVGGDVLSPRQRIVSEVFAIRAMYADSVSLPGNVVMEGENVSLLTNDVGYLTSLEWDTLEAYYDTLQLKTSGSAEVHWGNVISEPDSFNPFHHYHDGLDINTGLIPTARYSSYTDLITEGRIGGGSTIVTSANYESFFNDPDLSAIRVNGEGDSAQGALNLIEGSGIDLSRTEQVLRLLLPSLQVV